MKNKNWKILILLLFIIYIIFFSFNFFNKEENIIKSSPVPKIHQNIEKKQVKNKITLEINGVKYQTQNEGEISIADFMEKLKNEEKINFVEKNYTGMGKFIESINGIKNGEKNWIYYVNNKKANIGISNYKIKSGDVVSWKFEKNY